jgi:hypothetical protein
MSPTRPAVDQVGRYPAALADLDAPVTLLASWASYLLVGNADVVLAVGFAAAYVAVPTVVVAVLRPDLFDVERVLASTAAHAVFTTVLLAVFTAATLAAGSLVGGGSPVPAAAATALCAVLLAPLRGRLQRGVDRWLYPARKAAVTAVEDLQADTAAGRARPEQLGDVLRRALRDPRLRVAYLIPATAQAVDAHGEPVEVPASAVPVTLGREQIGALSAGAGNAGHTIAGKAADAPGLLAQVDRRLSLCQSGGAARLGAGAAAGFPQVASLCGVSVGGGRTGHAAGRRSSELRYSVRCPTRRTLR